LKYARIRALATAPTNWQKSYIIVYKLFAGRNSRNFGKNMSIPPEIAWLVPVVLPFIIGLLVGAIIKKTFKVLILITALIILLVATGIISLTFRGLFAEAMNFLPKLYNAGYGILNVLPYSSIAFLIGLALGLWFTR